MVAAARARLGYRGADDDEADAVWLLAYAEAEILPAAFGPPAGAATLRPVEAERA